MDVTFRVEVGTMSQKFETVNVGKTKKMTVFREKYKSSIF